MNQFFRSIFFALFLFLSAIAANCETFQVTNIREEGQGSFRQAIIDANVSPNFDTITFRLTPTDQPILITQQELPSITNPVLIDGWSQTGQETVNIEISVTERLPYVLAFDQGSDGSEIRGFALNSSGKNAIEARHTSNLFIHDNYIGTDVSGLLPKRNLGYGIYFQNTDGIIQRNVISANVEGGIFIQNTLAMFSIVPSFDHKKIIGNMIGLSAQGRWLGDPEGNARQKNGIKIEESSQISIVENTISGNHNNGIQLGLSTKDVKIIKNRIGIGPVEEDYFPNGENGILTGASNVWIGGTQDEGNIIAFQIKNGVSVTENSRNVNILSNRIFGYKLMALDLNGNGPTLNDRGDVDSGANTLLNYPQLISAVLEDDHLNIVLQLDIDHAEGLVQFFSNPFPDPNAEHGENQIFLGERAISRAAGDRQTITIPLARNFDFPKLENLSATTTVQGAFGPGTSEFSPVIDVVRPIDFGDAPDPIATAYHVFNDSLYLGQCVDADLRLERNIKSDSDDQNTGISHVGACAANGNDDDGVIFPKPIIAGTVNTAAITNKGDGLLGIWIDYNADGDFDDDGELVLNINANEGKHQADIFIPSDVFGFRYLRARLIPYGYPITPSGGMIGGEVEDDRITIYPSDSLEKSEQFQRNMI